LFNFVGTIVTSISHCYSYWPDLVIVSFSYFSLFAISFYFYGAYVDVLMLILGIAVCTSIQMRGFNFNNPCTTWQMFIDQNLLLYRNLCRSCISPAPPSYEECVQCRVTLREDGDSEYVRGNKTWAPMYPMYRQLSNPAGSSSWHLGFV